jgi:DNA helicase MCM9
MTAESRSVLTKYYQLQRRTDVHNSARTTIRLLESLIRLAQAHARLMAHQEVSVSDAVVAVALVESSMLSTALLSGKSALHTEFPVDPDAEFEETRTSHY